MVDTEEWEIFTYEIPAPDNLYVVYDSNAKDIGMIDDFSIRDNIISTYIQLKCVQEAIKINNRNVIDLKLSEAKTPTVGYGDWEAHYTNKRKIVRLSSSELKRIQFSIQATVDELLKKLRPYIDKLAAQEA